MSLTDPGFVALNIENDRLTAVHATAGGGSNPRVQIRAWLTKAKPPTLDLNDTAGVGEWVQRELREAGMEGAARRARVIFAVPRSEVILKRIIFPPGTPEADLPGMVRLQVVRQLTVAPENAAIDFISSGGGAGQSADLAKAGVTVLAGALQGDRIEWRRAVARAAGLKLWRIALKATGVATLLSEISSRRGCGIMGITLGCGSTEFVVVEQGQIVFARSTDLVRPDPLHSSGVRADEEAFAEKLAVEAKRTWMSYRVTPDSVEVESIVVLGADDCAAVVARRCQESLEVPAEYSAFPAFVAVPDDLRDSDRGAIAPLVGLIADPALNKATLDFANPRKAPDLGAARRQRVLIGSLAAILLLGGGYTLMRLDIQRRQEKLDELTSQAAEQSAKHAEFVRLKARLAHVEEWEKARFDWLAHVGFLTEELPSTRDATIDAISGRGDHEVLYTKAPGKKEYSAAGWSHRMSAVFTIDGKVKRREIADDLRLRLVDDKRYKLDSKGADTPEHFDWRLITTRAKPDDTGTDQHAPAAPPAPLAPPKAPPKAPATDAPKGGAK